MTRSVLCTASSSIPRPIGYECSGARRRWRCPALTIGSFGCFQLVSAVEMPCPSSAPVTLPIQRVQRVLPSNSAHKPTRPRSLARSGPTCTSGTLAAFAPAASALVAAASAPL